MAVHDSHSGRLHACRSSEQDRGILEVGHHAKSHLTGEAQADSPPCISVSWALTVISRTPQHKHKCLKAPA